MLDICQNKKFPCLCSYVPISETHQNMYNFPHSVEKIGRFHYSVLLGTPPQIKWLTWGHRCSLCRCRWICSSGWFRGSSLLTVIPVSLGDPRNCVQIVIWAVLHDTALNRSHQNTLAITQTLCITCSRDTSIREHWCIAAITFPCAFL